MKLLNSGNTKTKKGEKLGYITYGLHLAPFDLAGKNVCPNASKGCAAACLNTAGRGAMANVQQARINKTKFFFQDRDKFLMQLTDEIAKAIKSAARKNMKPCFRLNLTSDLPWEKFGIMQSFPDVQFYDYTKGFLRFTDYLVGKMPSNYHLTFSRSEENEPEIDSIVKNQSKGNIAAVFRNALPDMWNGRKVVNGDETDLRFLDPKGVIVGLVEKGEAKKDKSGFVIEA